MGLASLSPLSLAATAVYGVVVLACLAASVAALRQRQQNWHWRAWAFIGLLFAVFAVMRMVAFEEMLRDILRAVLQTEAVRNNFV